MAMDVGGSAEFGGLVMIIATVMKRSLDAALPYMRAMANLTEKSLKRH